MYSLQSPFTESLQIFPCLFFESVGSHMGIPRPWTFKSQQVCAQPLPLRPNQATLLQKRFQSGYSFKNNSWSTCWGKYMETKEKVCCICAKLLSPVHVHLMIGGSVSENCEGSRLVDSVLLYPSGPSILIPTLPQEFSSSVQCLVFDSCFCFSQLPSATFQRTGILDSCLQAQQSITYSVRD